MITHMITNPNIASARLRSILPNNYLQNYEFAENILIAAKHGWKWPKSHDFSKVVFDVCDDHFNTEHEKHYRESCDKADLITCNSKVMQQIIANETGRDSIVIDDPYEDQEHDCHAGQGVLWFGHKSNLRDVLPYRDIINLEVITNYPGFTQWTPEAVHKALLRKPTVIVPTGKSAAKSANRMIKAIRYGCFVVAGEMPAHSEIPGPWVGSIWAGLEYAKDNPKDCIERTKIAQDFIRDRYSPQTIGEQWLKALSSISDVAIKLKKTGST